MKNSKLLAAFLLLITPIMVYAQKLPAKQQVSLRAPVNIKIDGKATEWDNKFQAYNNATNIFYTIANDNDNLYLAVQATDPLITRKIIIGGVKLTIDAGKQANGKEVAITYPAFANENRPIMNLKDKPMGSKNQPLDNEALNSFISGINKLFWDRSKEIKVQGIPAITDSLISVYNDNDIKAVARFDEQADYIYELAIPLKYCGNAAKFNYTITLTGSPQVDGTTVVRDPAGNITKIQVLVGPGAPPILNPSDMAMISSPTYLTGEYTLATK